MVIVGVCRRKRSDGFAPVNHLESLANVNGNACFCLYPDFCAKAEFREKVQLLSLLRQADFAHQFSVTWIGPQGIERKVGPEAAQPVMFLVCGVEPLEGMVLVA
jgi:hypothetical protein